MSRALSSQGNLWTYRPTAVSFTVHTHHSHLLSFLGS